MRIYPDDCWVDTFEPDLSTSELDDAKRYWRSIWRAGGVETDRRAAWRTLASAHGSGRANYIADKYKPANLGEQPTKAKATDIILVISTQSALKPAEASAISTYWEAVWLADGDAVATKAARDKCDADVETVRAESLVEDYAPFNLEDAPASPLSRKNVTSSVKFVVFPADPPTLQESWTRAPRLNCFPDCFVVLGYKDGQQWTSEIGGPVTLPLYVGPDPQATAAQSIHPDSATGDLVVPNELKWLVDFPAAEAAGMGVRIPLTPEQARSGFDRLLVVGVQLSADETDCGTNLGELLQHHAAGQGGLAVLAQGTPTHNTGGASSGYGRLDDPDASFRDPTSALRPNGRSIDAARRAVASGGPWCCAIGVPEDPRR